MGTPGIHGWRGWIETRDCSPDPGCDSLHPNWARFRGTWPRSRERAQLGPLAIPTLNLMRANKMKTNPDKVEVLLVGSDSILGSSFVLTVVRVSLTLSLSVCSLGFLLDLGLLL